MQYDKGEMNISLIKASVIKALVVVVCLILVVPETKAQSLTSPNYEIDALGFFSADTPSDFAPPAITAGPTVSSVTGTSAVVQWTTDVVGSSIVAFGLTSSYGTELGQSEEKVINHSVKLNGLFPNTQYHFQVKSADAQGRYGRSTDQTLTTTNQPPISEVQVTDITLSSAIISWKTAALTTTTINYGTSTNYGNTVSDQSASSTSNHTVRLSGLNSGTLYHFRITGEDAGGSPITSDDYIFTTLSLPGIVKYSLGTITGNTAEILWETNIPTDSFVSFWKTADGESTAKTQGSPELVKSHRVVITGLEGKTEYNFRILGRDVSGNAFESNVLSFNTPLDTSPPVITNVKSEVSTNTKDDRLQLVVSWDTDEPSKSQVEYNIGSVTNDDYKLKSREDTNLNLNHIVIIVGLKPSTNYHFRIQAADAAGNVGHSGDYSVLTPQRRKSLLQIILEKLEQTFGWLRRVRIRG